MTAKNDLMGKLYPYILLDRTCTREKSAFMFTNNPCSKSLAGFLYTGGQRRTKYDLLATEVNTALTMTTYLEVPIFFLLIKIADEVGRQEQKNDANQHPIRKLCALL